MDTTDRPALARRLAALHRDVLGRYCATLPGGDQQPVAGGVAAFTAPGWPLNRLGGLPPEAVLDDDALAAVRDFYARHGAPAAIETDPMILSVPGNLERLAAHGFRAVWQRTTLVRAMAPTGPAAARRSDGPTVRRCADPRAFAELIARGFGDGRPADPAGFDVQVQIVGLSLPGAIGLVAELAGRPVGGGALRLVGGIAGLYGQATLPEARRRGVQRAIVEESLAIAAGAGCDLAVVDADAGGASERNLLRAGFEVAWTATGFAAPSI